MASFLKKRLNRFLNSPYKISEVEAEVKRFTSICATALEDKRASTKSSKRGQLVNQILKARREEMLSRLHTKSTFEEQRNFFMRCACERQKELQTLTFMRDTADSEMRKDMLATRFEENSSLLETGDHKGQIDSDIAFVILETSALTLVLSELYSIENFQNSKLAKISTDLTKWFLSYHAGMDDFSIQRPQQADFLAEIENKVDIDGLENFFTAIELGNLSGALKIANALMENRV